MLSPTKAQPKLIRKTKQSLQQHLQHQLLLSKGEIDDNDDCVIIDDELAFGRNRKSYEYGQVVHEEEIEISDYAKFRLFLARTLAMKKYHQTYSTV